jgi:hypothetical protein
MNGCEYSLSHVKALVVSLLRVLISSKCTEIFEVHFFELFLQYQQFLKEKVFRHVLKARFCQLIIELVLNRKLSDGPVHVAAEHFHLFCIQSVLVDLLLKQ